MLDSHHRCSSSPRFRRASPPPELCGHVFVGPLHAGGAVLGPRLCPANSSLINGVAMGPMKFRRPPFALSGSTSYSDTDS